MFTLHNIAQKWILASVIFGCTIVQDHCAAAPDGLAQQISRDFTAVAKKAIPAVVSIRVKAPGTKSSASEDSNDIFNDEFFQKFFRSRRGAESKPKQVVGQASGFIVSADGYVLTNSHVVKDATEIEVTLNDGREFSGKTVGFDPNTDIALVKIDGKNLPFVDLGDSNKLEIGEWVVAIGNPMGLQATLTVGVVSALGRNNLDITNIEDFIQTDAAINRGNSGGPLLNLDSQVIGMNTAIVTNMAESNMGLGFAIPSSMIKPVMDQIIKIGSVTRGFIGVTLQTIDRDLAHAFNVEQHSGALVTSISKDSPAEKSGLKQGDIIRTFNDHKVNNIATLRNAIALMAPGSKLNLTVLRDGKTMDIAVEVASFPVTKQAVVPATVVNTSNSLGLDVQDLTPEISKTLGLTDEKGVVVTKVDPTSPAGLIGLKKGALVMAINQNKVDDVKSFKAAVENLDKDKPVILLVKQGDAIRYISLRFN